MSNSMLHTTYETATTSDDLLSVRREPCAVDAKVLLVVSPISWHARSRGIEIDRNLLLRTVECGGHIHYWSLTIVSTGHESVCRRMFTREEYMTLLNEDKRNIL